MRDLSFLVVLGILASASAAYADGRARVIVGFKGPVDHAALARHQADSVEMSPTADTAVLRIPAQKIARLRAEASVAYVEEDAVAEILDGSGARGSIQSTVTQPAQSTSWGTNKVWGPTKPTVTGYAVKVAIIDTGVDLSHPDLATNIKGNVTFVSGTTTGQDDHGHGTHVAGIIGALDNSIGSVGVAPRAYLYAVKVFDYRGTGYMSAVASGVDWSRQNGMNICNMSLGSTGSTNTLRNACTNANAAGLLLVAAAGNSGDGNIATTETSYPAAYSSVVAVGATDSGDVLCTFSNTGSQLDVSAPGRGVYSTYLGGGYKSMSGTSMASPHAAGLAALLWKKVPPGSTIRAELLAHVKDFGLTGWDAGYGAGRASYSGQ